MDTNEVWDNVKDGTKKAAKTVAAVAVDIYEQGKKQVNIIQIKGEIRTCFTKLGELVYNESSQGVSADEERGTLIEKIGNLKSQLAQASANGEDVEGAKKECPKCGRQLEFDAVYCSGCGEKQ